MLIVKNWRPRQVLRIETAVFAAVESAMFEGRKGRSSLRVKWIRRSQNCPRRFTAAADPLGGESLTGKETRESEGNR
jgi:hypothetical protein